MIPNQAPWHLGHAEYGGYHSLIVNAGPRGEERVVPPAGEQHAFTRQVWKRRVEICVSPTGRSVRVWVDGEEVP